MYPCILSAMEVIDGLPASTAISSVLRHKARAAGKSWREGCSQAQNCAHSPAPPSTAGRAAPRASVRSCSTSASWPLAGQLASADALLVHERRQRLCEVHCLRTNRVRTALRTRRGLPPDPSFYSNRHVATVE